MHAQGIPISLSRLLEQPVRGHSSLSDITQLGKPALYRWLQIEIAAKELAALFERAGIHNTGAKYLFSSLCGNLPHPGGATADEYDDGDFFWSETYLWENADAAERRLKGGTWANWKAQAEARLASAAAGSSSGTSS